MKSLFGSAGTLACLVFLSMPVAAQNNPWNGSWKADPASLKYDAASYSVATDADGFTVTNGGEAQPKVVCDGKPHQSKELMLTCTKTAAAYSVSSSRNGKVTRKTMITISADGKTRTSRSQMFPPNGAPYTMTTTSKRVSGGPGFGGEWKEVRTTSSQDRGVLVIHVKGDMVAFQETDVPKAINCKLDGSDTSTGDNTTMAVKLADAHTLKVTYKQDGKVRRENTFAMSGDGKSITETDVTPAPAVSKMVVMLHKM